MWQPCRLAPAARRREPDAHPTHHPLSPASHLGGLQGLGRRLERHCLGRKGWISSHFLSCLGLRTLSPSHFLSCLGLRTTRRTIHLGQLCSGCHSGRRHMYCSRSSEHKSRLRRPPRPRGLARHADNTARSRTLARSRQHGSIPHSGSIPTTRLDPAALRSPLPSRFPFHGSVLWSVRVVCLAPFKGCLSEGRHCECSSSRSVAGTCRQECPIMSPFALVLWTPPTSQRERVRPSREPPMTWTYPSSIADQEERLNWSAGHAMQHPTPSYQRSLLPWQLCVLRPCRGSCLLCPQGWPSRRVARVASRSKLRVAPSR